MPATPQFPQAPSAYDPYRNYRFRVKWEDRYVAGFSKVSALTRSTGVVTHRSGGDPATPHRMPGQSDFAAITLERGVTYDAAFEQWMSQVWDYRNTAADEEQGTGEQGTSPGGSRQNIVLELYNEAGQRVLVYNIFRCWPSEFQAMPELDANGNAVAIQMLKLENEGWERDTSSASPTEPDFLLPAG